jgi:hypothetical protein
MFRACNEHFELSRSLPLDQKISPRLKQKKNNTKRPKVEEWQHQKRIVGKTQQKLVESILKKTTNIKRGRNLEALSEPCPKILLR